MQESFYSNLPRSFTVSNDPIELRLLQEYGSVFLSRGGVVPPPKIVFRDHADVGAFQNSVATSVETIGGFEIELQTAAMNGLRGAAAEAAAVGYTITPRGSDSGKRGYDETVGLWKSRIEPALDHWVSRQRLPADEAKRIRAMPPFDQVAAVLRLEEDGIWFAKDLTKSILYSVAPPGTSQHISMLAIDLNEFGIEPVRTILARHGWFQTVFSDLPHFTFLGVPEADLAGLGLRKVTAYDQVFWLPDI